MRAIEDVEVRDFVRTLDEPTLAFGQSPVIAALHHDPEPTLLIEFKLSNGAELVSSPTHLILVGSGQGTPAKYQTAMQAFVTHASGEAASFVSGVDASAVGILSASVRRACQPMFNLHVLSPHDREAMDSDRGHNYMAQGVVVHNCKGSEISGALMDSFNNQCEIQGGVGQFNGSGLCSEFNGTANCVQP